jgi:hypothetical protein
MILQIVWYVYEHNFNIFILVFVFGPSLKIDCYWLDICIYLLRAKCQIEHI